ncbi:MAG: YceI family protein [Deltaproteobacteria bacterium]|uniref:YceI family protein n=1 Tax=Desulfobacula sp. TaxID=2593537 RepID=UPI0019C56D62|nr:YceI family protein [Candidatus Desulfobacula maris]MBL6993913.1 YceI family protein [Desulfobacula sp.]
MKPLFKFFIIFILFFFASTANAFQWDIDPDHSEVRFEVKHIHAKVSGQFTDFKADLFFNPDTPDQGKVDFTIAVKSVNTHNGKRDNHLRSKDFFDSDKFPNMTFHSSKITHIKDNLYALEGMMTIKDVTQKMNLEFIFFAPQQHPFDTQKWVTGSTTGFVVPRLDFHVGDGKFLKMGVVGNEVDVTISIEALRDK